MSSLNRILTGGVDLGGIITKPSSRSRRATGGSDTSHVVKNIGKGCRWAGVDNCDLFPFEDCKHPTFVSKERERERVRNKL